MIPLWGAVALALAALAFFSACEAALTSLSRIRLRHWAGRRLGGGSGNELLERPQALITTIFVGTNLSVVCLAVTGTVAVAGLLPFEGRWPVAAVLAAVALVTPPAVLLGDVLPRTVVHERPGPLLPPLFAGSRALTVVFWPYVALMRGAAWALFRSLGVPARPEERSFTSWSIETLLREGEREGLVDRHEREIIGGIFAFGETVVREVMTPRTDVVAVSLGTSRSALARRIWETGFSRFPVTDGSPDNVVGIVHAVDVLKTREGERLRLRPTLFVPATMACDELLYAMRRQRIQLAVVVDEYGGVAGIVTMEDLVEELVGEIRDEHDRERPAVAAAPGRGLVVDGRARLSEVAEHVSLRVEPGNEQETVAGHLLRRLGRVPARGEVVPLADRTAEVVEATSKRVMRVALSVSGKSGPPASSPPEERNGDPPGRMPQGGAVA